MGVRVYEDGTLYEWEDSRFFWAQYYVEGTKYNESTGTAIEREAKAFLRRRITEKRANQEGFMDFVGPQRVTVARLLDGPENDCHIQSRKLWSQMYYHPYQTVRRIVTNVLAIEVDTAAIHRYIRCRQKAA